MFGESYNELVDIWSFGMCVLEMATNQYPYVEYNGSVAQLLKKGFEGAKPEALASVNDPAMREFICMCLQSADRRPSAKELLEQKVFDLTEPVKAVALLANAEIKQVGVGGVSSATGGGDSKVESTRKKEVNDGASNSTKLSLTVTARPDSPALQLTAPTPVVSGAPVLTIQPTPSVPSAVSVAGPRSPTLRGLREGVTPPLISPASSPHARAEPNVDGFPATNFVLATPSAPSSVSSTASTSSSSASSIGISAGLPSRFDPRRDLLRQRAEALIPKVSVSKTAELSVVSIVLYVHFPSSKEARRARKERKLRQEQAGAADTSSDHGDDSEEEAQRSTLPSSTAAPSTHTKDSSTTHPTTPPQPLGHSLGGGSIKDVTDSVDLHSVTSPTTSTSASTSSVSSLPPSTPVSPVQSSGPVVAVAAVSTPPLSLPTSPVSSTELTPIHINSYDFSRDNYLAVATDLVHNLPQFSLLELEGVEELVAFRIEEGTRERYNKWQAKARTTLNSEIMTLLTSLGIGLNYAVSFIEQEVSIEDLLYLSEDDLAAFIPKLGPRRRLQQWIAEVKATKRLQEVVEEEEEGPESEEERGEEKKRAKKGGKDKEAKDRDKDKEGGKGEKKTAKEAKGAAEKDKGGAGQLSSAGGQKAKKEREKDREKEERTKEKAKEKPKAQKKEEEEGEAQPRARDRVASVNTKPSKGEKEKVGAAGGGSGGEKKEKASAVKGEVERERGVDEKKRRTKEFREVEEGTLMMDRVDRTLRESARKLAVIRPSSALSNSTPSAPSSPHSAKSDSGSEQGGERSARGTKKEDGRGGEADVESREAEKPSREGRRRRADSDDFDTADRNSGSAHVSPIKPSTTSTSTHSTNFSVGPSSLTSTPELKGNKRSSAGVDAAVRTSRSGEKTEKSSNGSKGEREGKGDRRAFLDDADHSGMNSLLHRITQDIEPKGKKGGGEKVEKGSANPPATALPTSVPSVTSASSFSHSSPITAVVTNGSASPLLSRVLSGPSPSPNPLTHVVSSVAYSTSSASYPLNPLIASSVSSSTSSSSSSSSRSSSRPNSPSALVSSFAATGRRPSQPLLLNGVALSSIALPPSSVLSHRQSVPTITSPFTPGSTLPPPLFPSASAVSVAAPSATSSHTRTLSPFEHNGAPPSPTPQPLSRLS